MSDLISRGKLFNLLAPVQTLGEAYGIIQEMPTVDAVPVVRCADCIRYHRGADGIWGFCSMGIKTRKQDFCSYGVRKDGDGNG